MNTWEADIDFSLASPMTEDETDDLHEHFKAAGVYLITGHDRDSGEMSLHFSVTASTIWAAADRALGLARTGLRAAGLALPAMLSLTLSEPDPEDVALAERLMAQAERDDAAPA